MARAELPPYASEWLRKDENGVYVQKSLAQLSKGVKANTFKVYYTYLHRFFAWLGMSPDEAIAWAKQLDDKYVLVDKIQDFASSLKSVRDEKIGSRYNTKRIAYAAIRSGFMYSRIELPPDRRFRLSGDLKPVECNLTIEHIPVLIGLAIEPWRSAFLAKWHGLLDSQGLVEASNNHGDTVVKALRDGNDLVRLPMSGRKKLKNILPFETFWGPEPLAAIREYFENRRPGGWPKHGEAIWLYDMKGHVGDPIKTPAVEDAWLRLLRRSPLRELVLPEENSTPGTRYGFNVHNTRDIAISHLTEVPNLKEMVVEYWAGHQIDPLGYRDLRRKPQFVEAQYRLAAPYLNILGKETVKAELSEEEMINRIVASPRFVKVVLELIKRAPEAKANAGESNTARNQS